jgi:hypothetical protein
MLVPAARIKDAVEEVEASNRCGSGHVKER